MNYDFDIHPDLIFVITEIDNVITILEEIDPFSPAPFPNKQLTEKSDS